MMATGKTRDSEGLGETAAGERAAIKGERKQVTVLFVDIARSMELSGSLDAERWGIALDRFLAVASGAITELGGTTNHFTGDGLMAVFGAPNALEDHARRACLAALLVHNQMAPLAEDLQRTDGIEFAIRCGLNSGEVVIGAIGDGLHMDFASIGSTSALGQRMESLAPEGSTALSSHTASLIEGEFELHDMGEREVKGLSEPQRVYELLGPGNAQTRLQAGASSRFADFVGRTTERKALDTALERALTGEGQAIGIRGEPGVGKSRLAHELARDCRDRGLRVDMVWATAHGSETPLLLALGMLRSLFGVEEGDDPDLARGRVADALIGLDAAFESELPLLLDFLGLADPEHPLEQIEPEARQRRLLALVRRFVEARGQREPGVIVIEDLHWIDSGSAPFVDELVVAVSGTSVLLVLSFRPEYAAVWAGEQVYDELALAPLNVAASTELLRGLLGEDSSLEELVSPIQARTQGNPFFIEETVQALAEAGRLVGARGEYRMTESSGELALPPTVQAVLGARIDSLDDREKALLQKMSVIGKEIDRVVLEGVAGLQGDELAAAVLMLTAAEFIVEGGVAGERTLTFKHPLTQEVAYASQLSGPRREIHAAVAAAIERTHPDWLDERAALLAHHSERSGDLLGAARWHARAATWARASSSEASMRHWRRVRELAGEVEGSAEAEQMRLGACISILVLAFQLGVPLEDVAAIHAEGRSLAPPSPSVEGVLLDIAYSGSLNLGGREREGGDLVRAASAAAEEIGDPGLILNANCYAALNAWALGRFQECVGLVDRALSIAGDDLGAGGGLVSINPYAHCLWIRGSANALQGMFERAARDFEWSLEVGLAFSDPVVEPAALALRGVLCIHRREPECGLADAERALEIAERVGDNQSRVGSRGVLSFLLAECGRFSEAEPIAEQGLTLARDHQTGLPWRPELLIARAMARRGMGDLENARAAAEEALAIAEQSIQQRSIPLARLDLARTLLAADGALGGPEEIESHLRVASEVVAEIGYRAIEPQILWELAALARLRGEEAEAVRKDAEAERLLAELKAPDRQFDDEGRFDAKSLGPNEDLPDAQSLRAVDGQ